MNTAIRWVTGALMLAGVMAVGPTPADAAVRTDAQAIAVVSKKLQAPELKARLAPYKAKLALITDEVQVYDAMTDSNLTWKDFLAKVRRNEI